MVQNVVEALKDIDQSINKNSVFKFFKYYLIITFVIFSCGTRLNEGKSATIVPRFSLAQTFKKRKSKKKKAKSQMISFTGNLEKPLRSE